MEVNKRSLPIGTIVHNRYLIESVLGEGGFGVTYKIRDIAEGKILAMKEYMPSDIAFRKPGTLHVLPQKNCQEAYEKFRSRFLDEAKIIYHYRGHPNIIGVQHLFYENNTAYYVMEFIDGLDLGKILTSHNNRLSWSELQPIMAQVVSALRTVHSSGMVHCDISPDNIFVLNGGQVKLIDFGAAKSVLQGKSSVIMMKRGYAPPEQLSAQGKIGPWTDVYAVAVTIYRCCTGQMPPSAEDRLMNDQVQWPSKLGLPIPSLPWEYVLRKAMALRVDERYQSINSFWSELLDTDKTPERSIPILACIRGFYVGKQFQIKNEILLGRDPTKCTILFPMNAPGISAVHMRVWPEDGKIIAMDMGSSVGTWINGQKMNPGLAYILDPDSTIYLGDNQIFRPCNYETV